MSKVTFEFDSVEDSDELVRYQHCHEAFDALHSIHDIVRSRLKYHDNVPEIEAVLEEISRCVWEVLTCEN